MRPLDNFYIEGLNTSAKALAETENQLKELVIRINECSDVLTTEDKKQLEINIKWIKRFYEQIERNILNDN